MAKINAKCPGCKEVTWQDTAYDFLDADKSDEHGSRGPGAKGFYAVYIQIGGK